ncbi:MAG: response regulator transcription factor [Flavobacteriales bacterium]|nr:response regulator transcription factor [Flavobacteriales bacterium]
MAKMEILIIEDDPSDVKRLEDFLTKLDYDVRYVASSLNEALEFYMGNKVDLIIIDIFLNGVEEGITFAKTISQNQKDNCPFIFLTSANDLTIFNKAKETKPHSYLIKPFNELELQYAIELAIEKSTEISDQFEWNSQTGAVFVRNTFFIKKKDRLVKVRSSEIIFVEVEGRYCKLITTLGSFLIQSSLRSILAKLDANYFMQVHRNYIVNLECVKEVFPSDQMITMSNEVTVFLGETYRDAFYERYTLLK